jgi:hypothetical protein
MYVEGRVLTSGGEPVPGAVIETWETDDKGEQHFDFVRFFCGLLSTVVRSSFPRKATTTLSTPSAPHPTAAVG